MQLCSQLFQNFEQLKLSETDEITRTVCRIME